MPNNETSSKTENLSQTKETKRYVLLALIEHGSRPLAFMIVGLFVLFFLFKVKEPLFKLLERTEGVKYGSLELRLRLVADLADLSEELKDLKALNDQQIQLFLIVGKYREEHITYSGEEITEKNLNKLKEAGLLEKVEQNEDSNLSWTVSKKGNELHKLILEQVAKAIRGSPAIQ